LAKFQFSTQALFIFVFLPKFLGPSDALLQIDTSANLTETYFKFLQTFLLLCHINMPLKNAQNKLLESSLPNQEIHDSQ
jgi:hypothetical protein